MNEGYFKELEKRVNRQRDFFKSTSTGDCLIYDRVWGEHKTTVSFFTDILTELPVSEINNTKKINRLVRRYLKGYHSKQQDFFVKGSDRLPTLFVYFGIGAVTAAMTGRNPGFVSGTSWLECNMGWDEIEQLKFDQDNEWIQLSLKVNQALCKYWEGDFLLAPYIYRSPLDAANGIRGNTLFMDLYNNPDKTKRLINWCVDWNIKMEEFLLKEVVYPEEMERGIWSTWLPPAGVFVNGDPVGMINREMYVEFDRPFTGRFFTSTGGGYFHHHAIGMHQIDLIAETPGVLVQQICPPPTNDDVKGLNPADKIIYDKKFQKKAILASKKVPLKIQLLNEEQVDLLIPILKKGRFIISIDACQNKGEVIKKVKNKLN